MPHNFTRPTLPYVNVSLPNDNRFRVLTRVLNSPPTATIFDTEYNYIIDGMNELDNDIINVVAGKIPGSSNPANADGLVTTDGAGNLSFVKITNRNVTPASLPGSVLINSSVTGTQIGDGSITTRLLAPLCVTQGAIADGAVGTNQIDSEAVETDNLAPLAVTADKIANQTIIQTKMANASIGTNQIIPQSITIATLAQEVLDFFIPIGTIIQFAGTTGFSVNFLECIGQAISRTTYATLFVNIGTTYGIGDGSTTFNLPDMRGRISVGISSTNSTNGVITTATAPTIALGSPFGSEQHTLTIPQMPSHTHSCIESRSNALTNSIAFATATGGGGAAIPITDPTGGGLPHNNVQPSIFMRFYIRAL